jgi:transcriptional regulator with XRE-family HTH domain
MPTNPLRDLQAQGFSLRKLARDAGVDPSLLLRIVSGERRLTPAVAAKLAAALHQWASECRTAARVILTQRRQQ